MNKKMVLVTALVLVVLLAGCGAPEESGEPDPIPVRLEAALTGSIQETVNFSGDVTAGSEVQVVPKIAGRIARVAVQMGQEVKKGDLLVELEAQELAVGLRQAEAALAMARANLKSGQSGVTLAQKQQAEANYNNVKATLERMEALYAQGGISLQQLEGTRMQYQVAESQYTLAKQQLELYERGEGQIEVMAAQVKQAEAGLEMARLNYNNSRIIAPIDGVVAMVSAEVGNMASPGMAVATLVNVEGVTVVARLTEQTIGLVAPGMAVTVEVSGERFAGEVREVAPSPLTGSRSYPVKVRVFDASTSIRPGMFARVMVDVAASDRAVLVPRNALIEQDGNYSLFTVKEGRAVEREVTLGLKNDTHAEIINGFGAGESVVTAGQHFLRDGVTVLVEEGGLQ